MPAPLAIPSIENSFFPTRTRTEASLGRVSVVMMVLANFCAAACVDSQESITSGNLARIFSNGSGMPIMPVEEENISSEDTPKNCAALAHTWRQAAIPGFPVAQLALPELTTTARTLPLDFA